MKKLSIFLLFIAMSMSLKAQPGQTDTLAQKQVKQLAYMVGQWSGSGWMYSPDGKRHTFQQTEKVALKLDGTALLVEGHGTSNGETIHDALAIITYNKADSSFNFVSQLSNGKGGQFKGEINEGVFHWYPTENIRYIIALNEAGNWFEIGEINRNGNWFQFFEMTLTKQ